jgi:branched-chain amino acid transport system substrate-binding protein
MRPPGIRRALVAAAAATLLGASFTRAGTAADPFDVYVLSPQTGGASFYAASHLQTVRAIEAAVNRSGGIKGRPLHFIVEDDQSNPQLDVQLANQIIAKKVAVIVGPTVTAQCNAVAPLVTAGPVIYCFTPGAHPAPGSFVYAFGASTDISVATLLHYLGLRGLTRVATITSTDASGADGDRMLGAAAEDDKSVTLVAREHFNPTDLSVSAQISRIKAANPSVIVAWSTGTPFGTILHGLSEAGMDLPVATTNANVSLPLMKQFADYLPRELIFPGGPFLAPETAGRGERDAVMTMRRELAEIGAVPDQGHFSTWDPFVLVTNALRSIGPDATAEQIRAYIAGVKDWSGVAGTYNFAAVPQRGLDKNSIIMIRWDKTKGTWVAASRPGGIPLGK